MKDFGYLRLMGEPKSSYPPKWFIPLVVLLLILVWVIWTYAQTPSPAIDLKIIRLIESNNNDLAVSNKNCIGAFQISTAVLYEYNTYKKTNWTQLDLFYYDTNYSIARWYLEERIPQMLSWYRKPITIDNILIAYNFGIGNLIKYLDREIKLPKETQNYLRRYNALNKSK